MELDEGLIDMTLKGQNGRRQKGSDKEQQYNSTRIGFLEVYRTTRLLSYIPLLLRLLLTLQSRFTLTLSGGCLLLLTADARLPDRVVNAD